MRTAILKYNVVVLLNLEVFIVQRELLHLATRIKNVRRRVRGTLDEEF